MKLRSSKSVLFTIAAVLLTFGLAACGGSDGNGNGGGGGGLSQADFENYCSELKSCVGDQGFSALYGSVEDCASTQVDLYAAPGLQGECETAAQAYGECIIENFSCDGSQPGTFCEDEESNFTSNCSTGQ